MIDDLTGPKRTKQFDRPLPSKDIQGYTLGIKWDQMSASVQARIIRDCMTLARVSLINYRTKLTVACESDVLDRYFAFIGVRRTPHLAAATYWRLYSVSEVPEAPEHAEMTDVITVVGPEIDPPTLNPDSYFPKQVQYRDVVRLPPDTTVPVNRKPPHGPSDWTGQDVFL